MGSLHSIAKLKTPRHDISPTNETILLILAERIRKKKKKNPILLILAFWIKQRIVILTLVTSTGLTISSSTDALYVFGINWGLESPTAAMYTGTDELLGITPPGTKRK